MSLYVWKVIKLPATVTPLYTRIPPEPAIGAGFGLRLAAGGGALAAAVSAPGERVYALDVQTGKAVGKPLLPPAPTDWGFGMAVAVNGDRVVVGAPIANGGAGRVFVFKGGSLAYALDNPAATKDALFGAAVALHDDALVVGAPNHAAGAAYLFSAQTGKPGKPLVNPSPVKGDHFGAVVAAGSQYVAVAAPSQAVGAHKFAGNVHLYDVKTAAPLPASPISRPDATADEQFGLSMAIGSNALAVGAPYRAGKAHAYAGAVYVYDGDPATWSGPVILENPIEGSQSQYGMSLAIGDDVLAVVGIDLKSVAALNPIGSVHLIATNSWKIVNEITNPSDPKDRFADGIAPIAMDGDVLVVGAFLETAVTKGSAKGGLPTSAADAAANAAKSYAGAGKIYAYQVEAKTIDLVNANIERWPMSPLPIPEVRNGVARGGRPAGKRRDHRG